MNKTSSSLLVAGIGTVGAAIYMMNTHDRSHKRWMNKVKKNKHVKMLKKAYKNAF
ncbi:DUF3918 family protein [Geomicrobium sp. JCM 19038]|uniref:DUF3918 family protein n=1 Tax=Geomicrobium sp. JCM 19038 TaxID=1460635 RepID=UPI00045F1131|nr:DUF3918 family protein [Geomicrobium sp. JCM 19038]GAK06369.1 hypothetical protein JCM19038_62 [Geomicrobium sp. JCM 19038]